MENMAPVRVFADDMTVTCKYWETVMRKNYSQPEKELMRADDLQETRAALGERALQGG
jgi:hypothetical protein